MAAHQLPEQQYLKILEAILTEGIWTETRQVAKDTGVPVSSKAIIGQRMVIQPDHGMPLIRLRAMRKAFYFFIGEMLFFLGGGTKFDLLHKYGVHYWDDWNDAERRAYVGLEEGDMGPHYGKQWRAYSVGENRPPVDQIKELFNNIKSRPTDRRLIVNAWHPADSKMVVVRPCHGTFHVNILGGKVYLTVHQWSADFPMGIPSNLVMYKFLQLLICMKFGLEEGDLTYFTDDSHIYSNQVEGVKILLQRQPRPSPQVRINPILVDVLDCLLEGEQDPLALPRFNPKQLPYPDLLAEWVTLEGYNAFAPIPKELLPVAI